VRRFLARRRLALATAPLLVAAGEVVHVLSGAPWSWEVGSTLVEASALPLILADADDESPASSPERGAAAGTVPGRRAKHCLHAAAPSASSA
jgi:hypothetical protein